MRNFLTLVFVCITSISFAQVYFDGDSIVIETPVLSNSTSHQITIQNFNNLSESVSYWNSTGKGKYYSPWCNVRVSRSSFDYQSIVVSEWHENIVQDTVSIKVSSMPGRKVKVEVVGGSFTIRFRHITYGSWYSFMSNVFTFYPSGTFQEGTYVFFIPYRIKEWNIAYIEVHGNCSKPTAKLFYLN